MKRQFLDLGRQPIANGFLKDKDFDGEFFFDLKVQFDDETCLVSLSEFVPPEKMFNDDYVYHSSMSITMREHFEDAARTFINEYEPSKVMEIGSNDGVFVRHFPEDTTIAVEPCGNFAAMTNEQGYQTYAEFWNVDLARKILEDHGKQELIFSANCMCHIQDIDNAFEAIGNLLTQEGVFIFEDPSLLKMIERNSYDQIYDEHAHIFSVVALNNLLHKHNLQIFKVENLDVHGGSNRIFVKRVDNTVIGMDNSVWRNIEMERNAGLHKYNTYVDFAKKVEKSKTKLVETLRGYKSQGKKVVSYGATSKSTTVFNYCGIGPDLIDYIVDTTKDKQGKYSPGTRIPVISPESGFDNTVDVAFLGAWNFKKEILNKESGFLERGGKFVTHVPHVRVLGV
tara:strand:+ start:253 stop:1440 length:1188 start_codon:yes stop_codon:yes gene_type:complete